MSLIRPSDDTEILLDALFKIYDKNVQDLPIRSIHVAYGKLMTNTNNYQLDLFSDAETLENRRNLQLMIDEIHNKYGKNIITRLSALEKHSTTIERHTYIGGHRK